MGTHPIFESDFDCLTVFRMSLSRSRAARFLENSKKASTFVFNTPKINEEIASSFETIGSSLLVSTDTEAQYSFNESSLLERVESSITGEFGFSIDSVPVSFKAQLDFNPNKIVAITIPTEHDMSFYSPEMDQERNEVCQILKAQLMDLSFYLEATGTYAEAIDPITGQYLSKQEKMATPICESDPRLGQLSSFRIEDVNCCSVLKHEKFGSKCITGFLFIA